MVMMMCGLQLGEDRAGIRVDRLDCGFNLLPVGLQLVPEGLLVISRGVLVLMECLAFLAKAFALGPEVGIRGVDLVEVLLELGLFVRRQDLAPIAVVVMFTGGRAVAGGVIGGIVRCG